MVTKIKASDFETETEMGIDIFKWILITQIIFILFKFTVMPQIPYLIMLLPLTIFLILLMIGVMVMVRK